MTGGTPAVICDTMHALDPVGLKWYSLPRMPTARFEAACCTLPDSRIFVAGGIKRLDLNKGILANAGTYIQAGIQIQHQPAHEAGPTDFRGRFSQCGERSDVLEVFDPMANEWAVYPQLPKSCAGARACLSQDRQQVWLIGGSTGPQEDGIAMEFPRRSGV